MKYSLSVLALLAACGDDGGVNKLPDGAAPAPASVTIRIGGVPVPNHPITFQGPDGSEIATVPTDANGTASAVVQAGSSVTTLDVNEVRFNRPGRNVVTIMGVQPGDEITLRGNAGLASTNLTFTYPTFTGGSGTPQYGVVTNCNNNEAGVSPTSATLPVPRCAERIDVVMLVIDGLGGAEYYISKADQPFGNIDFSGESWMPIPTTQTTYTNAPEVGAISSGRTITSPRGPLYTCSTRTTNTGSTYTAQLSCPSFPGANLLDIMSYGEGQTQYSVVNAITTDSPTLDASNTQIKAPNGNLTLDIASRTIEWTEGSGLEPDFVGVHIETQDIDWHVIAPYTSTSLVLPRLLGEAATHDIEEADNPYPVIHVGKATGGYDAIRRFGPNYLDVITDEIPQILYAEYQEGS